MAMSSSQAETEFLQARETRSAALNAKRRQSSSSNDLHLFWSSLRQSLREWQQRLDTLLIQQPHRTATQRADASIKLDELQNELQSLQRHCLSETNDVPELPNADVRLLHQEFTSHAARLEEARNRMCPPTKFIFTKYRAAMKAKMERESTDSHPDVVVVASSTTDSTVTTRPLPVVPTGNAVFDQNNAIIRVEGNGTVKARAKGAPSKDEVLSKSNDPALASSLLLQNLDNCDVTLCGNYKALHLQNLSDCTVRVALPIDGAMHVTSCHTVTIYSACHQLRLHDSKDLHCHVQVSSGPILEGCTGLFFYASARNEMVYEAKDFNWLRNGIPSPNFTIVKEESQDKPESGSMVHPDTHNCMGEDVQDVKTAEPVTAAEAPGSDNEDSDDEL